MAGWQRRLIRQAWFGSGYGDAATGDNHSRVSCWAAHSVAFSPDGTDGWRRQQRPRGRSSCGTSRRGRGADPEWPKVPCLSVSVFHRWPLPDGESMRAASPNLTAPTWEEIATERGQTTRLSPGRRAGECGDQAAMNPTREELLFTRGHAAKSMKECFA